MSFVDTKLSKAKKFVNQGKFSDAKIILEEILVKFPDNIRAKNAINNIMHNNQNEQNNKTISSSEVSDVNEVIYLYTKKMTSEALAKANLILKKYSQNEKLNSILGCIYDELGNYNKALEFYKKALVVNPNSEEIMVNMGVTLATIGEISSAKIYYEKAIQINPNFINAYGNLGSLLTELAKFDEAIECFKKGLTISPNHPFILNNLGYAYKLKGNIPDAINNFKKAINQDINFVSAHNNLAVLYLEAGDYEKSLKFFNNAISIDNNNIETLINMGAALSDIGRENEAIECYQKVINMDPKQHSAISNLLLLSNYMPEFSNEYISNLHKQNGSFIETFFQSFDAKVANRFLSKISTQTNIGIVSGDLHQHSVTYFLEPLLKNINRENFSISCYYNGHIKDEVTKRIRSFSNSWHEVEPLTDEQLYSLIKKDEIDILIDLSGHTKGNRMPVFAMKPANIQLSWLGYPNTTGLKSIDYRIVDHFTDPISLNDHLYTEKLLRVDGSFLCFSSEENVAINKNNLFKQDDFFTFGSFNNLTKMSDDVLDCWAQILLKHKNSRIILKNKQLNSNYMRDIYLKRFKEHGVSEERIILLSWSNSRKEHLNLYNSIDLALDTFPYNGTTTTFESLWMNVPVLCIEGDNHCGRVSYSILKNLGFEDFISNSKEDYVEKALYFAQNQNVLNDLSSGLRERLIDSNLCDAQDFTKKIEQILKKIIN